MPGPTPPTASSIPSMDSAELALKKQSWEVEMVVMEMMMVENIRMRLDASFRTTEIISTEVTCQFGIGFTVLESDLGVLA